MHYVDIYWLIMPTHPTAVPPDLLDWTSRHSCHGGFFMAAVGWFMFRQSWPDRLSR